MCFVLGASKAWFSFQKEQITPLYHAESFIMHGSHFDLVCVLGPQCAYLTGGQQVVGQVSFLSQGIIYGFKVALLHHVEGLRKQQQHKASSSSPL